MKGNKKKVSSNFFNLQIEANRPTPISPSSNQTEKQESFPYSDSNIYIDREGKWFHNGAPINRKELLKLFSGVLQKDQEDRFWLVTPAEKEEIIVEDAPFMAVELLVKGKGKKQNLVFRTNMDEYVQASLSHPIKIHGNCETGEPEPYILVRNNLDAKLTRSVFYQLVDLGVEEYEREGRTFGVWSNGTFFEIGKLN